MKPNLQAQILLANEERYQHLIRCERAIEKLQKVQRVTLDSEHDAVADSEGSLVLYCDIAAILQEIDG